VRSARAAATTRVFLGYLGALLAPVAATAALVPLGGGVSRDYVFIYLAVVAVLAVVSGLGAAMCAAVASFLLVDYFFVVPVHTLSIADQTDVINLIVFVGTAFLVGGLGARRRRVQLRAEALSVELRHANAELERLNREQAETAAVAVRLARTEQQVHALEETDRLRAELLGNVSHELRTPLATILTGATDLLNDGSLAQPARTRIRSVVAETQHLGRLVSDMLDIARIEGRALRLDPADVDLRDAAQAAVERLHLISPSRVVLSDFDETIEVTADWGRLGQVLDNLLRNADLYSPAGTPIRIEAARGKRSMVVIRIIDQGPGIPVEERERVFDRFVRSTAGSDDAHRGGTGLGLAIVRGLVEAHAGRVWVEESRDGEGTRLAFALPAAGPSAVAGEDVHVDVDE
jgi:two-component system, OmpR family, sensor histidine kinase KdpD